MNLDNLDAERGGPMLVRELGRIHSLRSAVDLPWSTVVSAVGSTAAFVRTIWPAGEPLVFWKATILQERWGTHNGLLPADQLERLVYMMKNYGEGLEYDLRARLGVSLGELWRQRHWRELLGYMDQLPSDSHVNRLMMNDESYVEHLLSRNRSKEGGPRGPSISEFGMINSQLATLIDAVNRNTVVTRVVAGAKNVQPISPQPRPITAINRVQARLERERHSEMVAMLLPEDRPTTG